MGQAMQEALDPASLSSANLLRVLLAEYHDLHPAFGAVGEAQLAFLESERETLAGNAQKAFGRKLRVVLKAGGDEEVDDTPPTKPRPVRPPIETTPAPAKTAAATASSAKAAGKAALKSRAMVDPVVERTLDLFGGTLLDVKPLDTPPETTDGEES